MKRGIFALAVLGIFLFSIPYVLGALTTRVEVNEKETAEVFCSGSEVIESIEAYYYCSDNIRAGIYCPLPEADIIGKMSSYSFRFTNSNCGADPCEHIEKKGILLIKCDPAEEVDTLDVPPEPEVFTSSFDEREEEREGFVGFIKSVFRRIVPSRGDDSETPATVPQTEEDRVIEAVLNNDLETIRAASKPLSIFALDQYALENEDISVCDEGSVECVDKVLFFSCAEEENQDLCEFEIINEMRSSDEINNPQGGDLFAKGNRVYIRTSNGRIDRYKLSPSESHAGLCDVDMITRSKGFSSLWTWSENPFDGFSGGVGGGTIVSSATGTSFEDYISLSSEGRDYSDCSRGYCGALLRNNFWDFPFVFDDGSSWTPNLRCNEEECNLLDPPYRGRKNDIGPRGDLLCGHDTLWYLCDSDDYGVQNFNDGEQYFCNHGKWTRIKQYSEVV